MLYSAALLKGRVASLEKANEAATTRRKRKKRKIQQRGTLTKAEAEDIIAQQEVEQQLEGETRQGKARSGVSRQASARCSRCRETGYNAQTCKKDTIDTS